jgi:hypothetical protein
VVVNPACTEVMQPDACMIVYQFKESAFPWSDEAVKLAEEEKEKKKQQLVSKMSEPGLTFLDGARVVRVPCAQARANPTMIVPTQQ